MVVVSLAVAALLGAAAGTATAQGEPAVRIEVRVWQNVGNERDIRISARPADGSWRTLGTVPVDLVPVDEGRYFNTGFSYADFSVDVPQRNGGPETIEVRLWQKDDGSMYINARPFQGWWWRMDTVPLPLDDGLSKSGSFRYGDIQLDVSFRPADINAGTLGLTIEFEDEFSAPTGGWTQSLREEFNSVAAFFYERHGVAAPDLTIIMKNVSPDLPVFYCCNTISLTTTFLGALEHEYIHAIQDYLDGPQGWGPRWMTEGVAEYFERSYAESSGGQPVGQRLNRPLEVAIGTQEHLEDIERAFRGKDIEEYALSLLAVDYLVSLTDESRLWAFHRALARYGSWKLAFSEAFGLSVAEFYEEFAAHREAVAPALPHVQGTVLDPQGEPVARLDVWTLRPDTSTAWLDETRADGTFSVPAAKGANRLRFVHRICGAIGYFDGDGGITRDMEPPTDIMVDSTDVTGLVVTLPVDPALPCTPGALVWRWWEEPMEALEFPRMQGIEVTHFAGLPGSKMGGVPKFRDGPSNQVLFYQPRGMAVDASGNVLVADTGNQAIRSVAPDGTVTTIAGGNGKGVRDGPCKTAKFATPLDVAIADDGSIYVADAWGANRIRRITPGSDCRVTTVAGGGAYFSENGGGGFRDGPAADARFRSPSALTFDREGNLIIADNINNLIRRLSPDGQVTTIAGLPVNADGSIWNPGSTDGPRQSALFALPEGIAVDTEGNIFFTEANSAIRMIDQTGFVSTVLKTTERRHGGELSPFLREIVVGKDGALYVADMDYGRVVRITRDGTLSIVIDGLSGPQGLAVMPDGALLVSDLHDNSIHKITFTGH